MIETAIMLINAAIRIIKAGDDRAAQDEALMRAAEDLKAEMDRRKFGG